MEVLHVWRPEDVHDALDDINGEMPPDAVRQEHSARSSLCNLAIVAGWGMAGAFQWVWRLLRTGEPVIFTNATGRWWLTFTVYFSWCSCTPEATVFGGIRVSILVAERSERCSTWSDQSFRRVFVGSEVRSTENLGEWDVYAWGSRSCWPCFLRLGLSSMCPCLFLWVEIVALT